MKKTLLLGVALATMMASCSSDEVVDTPPQPTQRGIGFSTFVDKNSRTNEDLITTDNLTEFAVYAMVKNPEGTVGALMTRQEVTKGTDGKWTYSPIKYWDGGYNYTFLAYAPVNRISVGSGEGRQITVTPPTSVSTTDLGKVNFENRDGEIDFVAAFDNTYATTAVPATGDISAINFTFKHVLCKVTFAFENQMTDASDIEVTNVSITNAPKVGESNLKSDIVSSEWTAIGDTKATLAFAEASTVVETAKAVDQKGIITQGSTKETRSRYLIPFNQTYEVTFKIVRHIANGMTKTSTKIVTVPIPSYTDTTGNTVTGWKSGCWYRFTAVIDENNIEDSSLRPIKFEASVTTWDEANKHPHDIDIDVPATNNTPAPTSAPAK